MSFLNIPSLEEDTAGQRVFSTARYLDSPLLADTILPKMASALNTDRVAPDVYHLRRMYQSAYKIYEKTCAQETRTPLKWGQEWRPVLIAPSQIIRIADMIHHKNADLGNAADVAIAARGIAEQILSERGCATTLPFNLSQRTSDHFEWEMTLTAPQRSLVARRAEGSSEIIIADLATDISDKIILSDSYFLLLNSMTGVCFCGTYHMYLAVLDIIRVKARALLATDLFHTTDTLADRLMQQWAWQSKWIYEYENEGFALAKQTEALNKTYLGYLTDPETRIGGAYEGMWNKLQDKITKLTKGVTRARVRTQKARREYEAYVQGASLDEVVQLFGVQKAIGHPFIDSARGGLSAAKEAQEDIKIAAADAFECREAWRSMFVAGYLAREKKWPEMHFSSRGHHTKLYKWYSSNYLALNADDFDLSEWKYVVFGKNFVFDEFDNYLELMDDKALSFERDDAEAYWDNCMKAKTDRRLLLEITSREGFKFRAILEVVEEGNVQRRWRIVCVYPKEKELKADARMFSMMVLDIRTVFNGGEANLARHIFPYLSAQTMTKSKEEIHRIFYEFTRPRETDDQLHMFLECDLSRWNLRWRKKVVNLIGSDLNNLFGLKRLYTYAHTFFESSIIVVRVPGVRPPGIELDDPPESAVLYKGWKGGFEGIQQKLWTICTYAMIARALRNQNLSYVLIGQGDNQILSIVTPRHPYLSLTNQYSTLACSLTDRLSTYCKSVGQELKPEECLHSRTVITYSKEVWVNGVMYPLAVKYFSRIGARTNDEVPTLCAEISGLHAAGVAAAEANLQPVRVYAGVVFLHALEINARMRENHPSLSILSGKERSRYRRLTVSDHIKILYWPSTLGGIPISSLSDYLHRGTGDELSEQLAVFFRACKASPLVAPLYSYYIAEKWLQKPKDNRGLILAPHSLPLKAIPTARSSITSLVIEYIRTIAKNTDLKDLLSETQSDFSEDLLDCLGSMRPMYPLIAREIFDNSSAAEIERLSKMFVMTQTIQKAARAAGVPVSSIITHASALEWQARVWPLMLVPQQSKVLSPPLSLYQREPQRLRQKWEVVAGPVYGVDARSSLWSDVEISIAPSQSSGIKFVMTPEPCPHRSIGSYPPYLGARTKVARSSYGYRLIGDGRAATAIKRLRILVNMPGTGPNLQSLLHAVARSRGNIQTSLDVLAGGVSSSRFDHRYHARSEERGSHPVGPYNISTQGIFYTEQITGISGSPEDYPIMFQEYFTDLLGLATSYLGLTQSPPAYLELTLKISHTDVDVLPSLAIDVDKELLPDVKNIQSHSHLLYDENVWRMNLTGSIPRKSLSADISRTKLDIDLQVKVAIDATMRCLSFASADSHAAVDAALHKPPVPTLDLIEVINAGAENIFASVVKSAVMWVANSLITEVNQGGATGKLELMVRRCSSFYANVLLVVYENPQTWNDKLIQSLGLGCVELVSGLPVNTTRKLKMLLSQRIRRLMHTVTAEDRDVYIYESEQGSTGSRVLLSLITRVLLTSLNNGTSWGLIKFLFTLRPIKSALSAQSEGAKLHYLRGAAAGMLKYTCFTEMQKSILERISEGEILGVINSDYRLAIRQIREYPIAEQISPEDCLQLPQVRVSSMPSSIQMPIDPKYWSTLYTLNPASQWRLSMFPVRGSVHSNIWLHYLQSTRERTFHLIGVGHGYAAAAALTLPDSTVYGYDLLKAYKLRSLRGNAYPYAIHNHARRNSFSWAKEMYSAGSTLDLRAVIQNISHTTPALSCVLFDIQPYLSIEELENTLPTVCKPLILILRIFSDIRLDGSILFKLGVIFDVISSTCYVAGASTCSFIRIRLGSNTRSSTLLSSQAALLARRRTITLSQRDDSVRLGGIEGWQYLEILFEGPLRTNIHRLSALYRLRGLIGRHTASDKYVRWTLDLAKIALLEWWVEHKCAVSILDHLVTKDEMVIHDAHQNQLKIRASKELKDTFAKYGATILLLQSYGCC